MELLMSTIPGLVNTSTSVIHRVDSRQPVHKRKGRLSNRMRAITCMLTDIEAEIGRLQLERIQLCLVQKELAEMRS